MIHITSQGDDAMIDIKVVPKSSRDRIVGELDGALKVAVSAAPERGAANKAVCKLLARHLGLRVQAVTVETGHSSPRKTIRVAGITSDKLRQSLES